MHDRTAPIGARESPLVRSLAWRKVGKGWQLFARGRRFGKVIPDSNYPGMWRIPLSGGRVSDMANLSWARNAVLDAAIREIQWEERSSRPPSFIRDSGGDFPPTSPHSDLRSEGAPDLADSPSNQSTPPLKSNLPVPGKKSPAPPQMGTGQTGRICNL
jgi:hypothetical protein